MALYSLLSGAHYASCSSVLCQWLGKLEQNIEIIEKPQKRRSSLEEAHQRPSAEITKANPVAHYTVQAWEGQQQVTACSVQKIVEMSLKIMEPERFNSGKSWWCNACENCEICELNAKLSVVKAPSPHPRRFGVPLCVWRFQPLFSQDAALQAQVSSRCKKNVADHGRSSSFKMGAVQPPLARRHAFLCIPKASLKSLDTIRGVPRHIGRIRGRIHVGKRRF